MWLKILIQRMILVSNQKLRRFRKATPAMEAVEPMALVQGVGVLAGLNERTGGLLTRMALAMRANLTGRRKRGRCRSRSGANGWGRFGGGSAVTAS